MYVKSRQPLRTPRKISSKTQLSSWVDLSSSYVSVVADYAAEIENSVGTEIYAPIMKAGVFIFASGFISCFLAAFIVSKSDTWAGLEEEFQAGKEAQLIDMADTPSFVNTNERPKMTTTTNEVVERKQPVATASIKAAVQLDSFADLDI
jgi:hypothetical protein